MACGCTAPSGQHQPRSSVVTCAPPFLPLARGDDSCMRMRNPTPIIAQPESKSLTWSRDAFAKGKQNPTKTTPAHCRRNAVCVREGGIR